MADEKQFDINFISVAAFDSLAKQERDFLCARFSDPLFMRFLDAQEEAARHQLTSFSPDEQISDAEFRRLAREYRLVWRFWSDFRDFTQQFAARSA